MTDTIEYVTIPVYDPRATIPHDHEKVPRLADILEAEIRLYSQRWDMTPEQLSAVVAVLKNRLSIKAQGR